MKNSISLVGTLILASLTGCQLSDNAQKSAENSGRAADNSDKLLNTSMDAYGDGRQGATRDRREKSLQAMEASEKLGAKAGNAAAYFSSFEFQLYKSEGYREDNSAKRERLFAEAVAEFMKTQKDYIAEKVIEEKVVAPAAATPATPAAAGAPAATTAVAPETATVTKKYVPSDNFTALALAMHKVSERQFEASQRYQFAPKSMFDLLSDALAAKTKSEEDLAFLSAQPAYVYEALRDVNDVIMLFQVRANAMAGSAAEILSTTLDVAPEAGTVALKNDSAVKIKDASDRMKLAIQAKLALKQANVKLALDPRAKAGLAQWSGASAKISGLAESAKTNPKFKLTSELKGLIDGLLAE